MTALIQDTFRIQSARQFIDSVNSPDSTYYLFYSRARPWPNDSDPEIPKDSISSKFDVWMDMLALNQIDSSSVAQAISRNNWETGTVYDIYRHDISADNPSDASSSVDLLSSNFYVVNSELNVYKCIDNNNGTASTVEPTGTYTTIQVLSDGYAWKFMYGLTSLEALRFVSPDYILVKDVDVDDGTGQIEVKNAAVDGAIHHIAIENAGTGYSAANTTVSVSGNGTGFSADITADDIGNSGEILSVTINDPGSGYKYGDVTISGDGSGATGTAIISPAGGHGSNAIQELGGFQVFINVQNTGGEDNLFIDNAFRVLGLIVNPEDGSGSTLSSSTISLTKKLNISGESGSFNPGDIIVGQTSGANAYLVYHPTGVLEYTQTLEESSIAFSAGETVSSNSGGTATIDSLTDPDVSTFSGQILYIENRRPIVRATDQQEDIKLIIEW